MLGIRTSLLFRTINAIANSKFYQMNITDIHNETEVLTHYIKQTRIHNEWPTQNRHTRLSPGLNAVNYENDVTYDGEKALKITSHMKNYISKVR